MAEVSRTDSLTCAARSAVPARRRYGTGPRLAAPRLAGQSGVVLVMVLVLLAISVVLGLSYLSSASIRMACSNNAVAAKRAKYLAESGVQHGVHLLRTDPGCLDGSAVAPVGPFYADESDDMYVVYAVADADVPGQYRVSGEGTVGGVTQRCTVTARVGSAAQLTPEEALLVGNGSAALPSSLSITGGVHVNGNLMTLAHIDGDVSCTGSIGGIMAWITGSSTGAADEMDVPSIEFDDYEQYVLGDTEYSADEVELEVFDRKNPLASGNAVTSENPGGIVVLSSPDGGPVYLSKNLEFAGTLVVDGDLALDGQNIQLTAVSGFPALVVSGRVYVRGSATATINGLVVAAEGLIGQGNTRRSAITINGGLIATHTAFNSRLAGRHELNYDPELSRIYDFGGGNGGSRSVDILRWDD